MAEDFEHLPVALQRQIDAAFDAPLASTSSSKSPPKKRRKLNSQSTSESAGGFIVDDIPGGFIVEDADNPGGFIPPEEEHEEDPLPFEDDLLPFSLIPAALQLLDLPPDDEEVLQVLRNAASGWSSIATSEDVGVENGDEDQVGAVSRKDWRAVCAVVVGSQEEIAETDGDAPGGSAIESDHAVSSVAGDSVRELDEEDDDDAYENSSLSAFSDNLEEDSSDPESDDEYMVTPSKSKSKTRRAEKAQRAILAPGDATSRQKKAAVEAFALFFPSSPHADLSKKRLMFKDVVNVAELLKEKIKAQEITEMMSLFSSTPDKSMSLDDFTRMMVMAKLV